MDGIDESSLVSQRDSISGYSSEMTHSTLKKSIQIQRMFQKEMSKVLDDFCLARLGIYFWWFMYIFSYVVKEKV